MILISVNIEFCKDCGITIEWPYFGICEDCFADKCENGEIETGIFETEEEYNDYYGDQSQIATEFLNDEYYCK